MSWNFALILFVLLVITGAVWLLDLVRLRGPRRARMQAAADHFDQTRASVLRTTEGEQAVVRERAAVVAAAGSVPWWVEYSLSFFPVILFVFVLRSFVVEPFRIPSGSMLPTLQSGDLILVNKFNYGVRLPIVDAKVIETGSPARGDVMVFRYPPDPSVDYIKRVVGLPGDEVAWLDKRLTINGKEVPQQARGDYFEPDRAAYTGLYREDLGDIEHEILVSGQRNDVFPVRAFPYRDQCTYEPAGVRCTVPAGHYFVMGDNRDNSADSRYWGFVPDGNIVGRAFFIWMNFGDLSRIGKFR